LKGGRQQDSTIDGQLKQAFKPPAAVDGDRSRQRARKAK
jgi:hypothetical protein